MGLLSQDYLVKLLEIKSLTFDSVSIQSAAPWKVETFYILTGD